jgi:hypothetical protein
VSESPIRVRKWAENARSFTSRWQHCPVTRISEVSIPLIPIIGSHFAYGRGSLGGGAPALTGIVIDPSAFDSRSNTMRRIVLTFASTFKS